MSFTFENLRFDKGIKQVEICGYSPIPKNTIRMQFQMADGQKQIELIEFERSESFVTRTFHLKAFEGQTRLEILFMPGSQFDFKWLKFKH